MDKVSVTRKVSANGIEIEWKMDLPSDWDGERVRIFFNEVTKGAYSSSAESLVNLVDGK